MEITYYVSCLKRNLTPKRVEHSLGVMTTMEELAAVYGIDKYTAILTGLLHDAAKELQSSQWETLLQDSGIEEDEYDYEHYLHGPVGALLVQQDLGIKDEDILAAIATHGYYGTWEQFNRPLGWCLRMADILEPGRNWSSNHWLKDIIEPIRKAVYTGHLAESAWLWTGCLIEWYEADDIPVHPNIRRVCIEYTRNNEMPGAG